MCWVQVGQLLVDHSEPLCCCFHSKASIINTNVLLQIYIYISSLLLSSMCLFVCSVCLSVVAFCFVALFFFFPLKAELKLLLRFCILTFCSNSIARGQWTWVRNKIKLMLGIQLKLSLTVWPQYTEGGLQKPHIGSVYCTKSHHTNMNVDFRAKKTKTND